MKTTRLWAVLAFLLAPLEARAWPPGDTRGIEIQFQDLTRTYNVHVPASYDGSTPVPLVLDFHGYSGNGAIQEAFSGFDTLSDGIGFIVAYPDGYGAIGRQSWNSGICCDPALADGIDDVGFARAVVADVARQANIDPTRVYATGLSNGGGMSHRLACEAGDVFAAVAPVACPLLIAPFQDCRPIRPVPVLHFAGLTDQEVPYEGGPTGPFPDLVFPAAQDSFAYWAEADGCGTGPAEMIEDLGNGASCETHAACGAGVEVGLCSIHGNLFFGHILYGNSDGVDVTQRAWDFMSQFTLPPACPPAATDGCHAAASRQAVLRLETGASPDGRKLRWKWVNDGTVLPGDFGDPTATTAYALCVYDQTGRVMTATVPAAGTCAGKPCWAPTGTGARYGNKTLLSDGLRTLSLKSGGDGQARIKVKGKAANLRVPTLPLTTPVCVQLRRLDTGACWEATYGSARANTPTAFKARSD